jgi:hypothetical protein
VTSAKAFFQGSVEDDETDSSQQDDREEEEGEDEDERTTFIGNKAKEMDQQIKILKLEKELAKARADLGNIRKSEYAKRKKKESKAKP